MSNYPDIYPEAKITGYYGQLTKQAVQKLQLKYDITNQSDSAYGYVGPKTRVKLNELLTTNHQPQTIDNQQLINQLKQTILIIEAKIQELLKQLQALKSAQ